MRSSGNVEAVTFSGSFRWCKTMHTCSASSSISKFLARNVPQFWCPAPVDECPPVSNAPMHTLTHCALDVVIVAVRKTPHEGGVEVGSQSSRKGFLWTCSFPGFVESCGDFF
eukprot:2736915-Amphidinium_carterae.1